MKIKTKDYIDWLLSAVDVKKITHGGRNQNTYETDCIDHASMYPKTMIIPRQLGHE